MAVDPGILTIPKAELHIHIEGTVTPDMARRLALKNNIVLDPAIFSADGMRYQWRDFYHLVTDVYNEVARTIRTAHDYEDITYDYLTRCAAEGSLYEELIIWCSQGDAVGLPYTEMVAGMAAAVDRAEAECGIVARMNTAMVRHQPFEAVAREAKIIAAHPHPYIVGLDLAGGERLGDIPQYQPLFDGIFSRFGRPLGMRLHAGEAAGPENIRAALALHPVPARIGHGVRCIEDESLVQELAARKVVLEVCPTSNVLAGIYNVYAEHPLRRLYDAGVRVCLNSDDPGLFGCSLAGEYQVAHDHFSFTAVELVQATRTALEASFCDETTRWRLLGRLPVFPA
ncbi:MAG: adenosine deaminase [Micavibrio aeruginosavorus]|uniref:Adenosine deaminase n=1 Tax=Micavibrio aeruginosavorus TaxID=349221 RepID=A0A7T5R1B9_9BACT|nr:MAG: adenosine deaminase [Micavibrio aeruginosavorus]